MPFLVTAKASTRRPAEPRCFYCEQPIGTEHKDDCVFVSKRVKLRLTVEYEVRVPAHWDKNLIEFSRNDGSWCASNLVDELQDIAEREGCLCNTGAEFEYLADASEPYLEES